MVYCIEKNTKIAKILDFKDCNRLGFLWIAIDWDFHGLRAKIPIRKKIAIFFAIFLRIAIVLQLIGIAHFEFAINWDCKFEFAINWDCKF